jgi:predicted phage terminase large subunit-like protein
MTAASALTSPSIETTQTFELTPRQKEVRKLLSEPAKFFLIYGGSRSGKTFLIVYALIMRMLKAPGSRHAVFRNDGIDAKQSIGNETVPAVLALAFPGLVLKWHDQDGYYQAPNGSQLWLAGLKDKARLDKVLGKEFASIYLNEASQITLEAFGVVQTRLAQSVKETDGRRLPLRLYVDLNPTVAAHWTYQIWINGIYPGEKRPIADKENYRHITINPADNAANLPPDYIAALSRMPERMRRRFYEGAFTADDDNALWRRAWIQLDTMPEMGRVVVSVDPATTSNDGSNETGIIVAGLGKDGRAYVIADESGKFRPEEWARRAISLFDTYDADYIVAETNQGGDMVEQTIKSVAKGRTIPYRAVTATRGKHVRATPVSAQYEQGKVRHVDDFPELVDQMCAFTIDFDRGKQGYSPDRVDALVWALTDLFPAMVAKAKKPELHIPPREGFGANRRF